MNNNYPAIQARVSGRFEARQIMRKQHLRRTFSCESIARGQHQEKHKTKERKHSIREQWNDTWMAIDLGRRRNDLNSKSQRMGLKMEEIDDVIMSFIVSSTDYLCFEAPFADLEAKLSGDDIKKN
ncbi:CLUMA_CG002928, isoform A [Clunio marinus]|uniref:CLUMA_CG002928, isoform A n=1 Tax=Clunio marinus TaxID=568069 RepID=A0A1J1HM83_9DIPT|nr:CLUMA_CG002928, isoform A [Clunio marinus]